METLLGIDVGTTATKAVLYDLTGNEVVRAVSPPHPTKTPQSGWVEQDPHTIWRSLLATIKNVMQKAGPDNMPRALAMAVQSGSLLPANGAGEPLSPIITWLDGRTASLVADWRRRGLQEEVKSRSGWSLHTGLCLPTIAWLRLHRPDLFSIAGHYFSVNDYLAFRLTGERITNPSNAGGMQLVNIFEEQWDETLCSLAGITPAQLSKIHPAGSIVGELLPAVCAETGLDPGILLINGAHDQVCTALGLGVTAPGRLLLACGTAWVFTGVATTVLLKQLPRLDWNFHAIPRCWTISQSLGGLGRSMEWWVQRAWGGIGGTFKRAEMFSALNAELDDAAKRDTPYFLPLTGGHRDPATTEKGGFLGLQLRHTRADMALAVMESAGYELHWALEPLISAGFPIGQLSMVGGAAQSRHWPQILADITGLPILVPQYDFWPALGAAILAGTALGYFSDFSAGVQQFRKLAPVIQPDPQRQIWHTAKFINYQQHRS